MRKTRITDPVLLGELTKCAGVSRSTMYIMAVSGAIPDLVLVGGRYELPRESLGRVLTHLRAEGRIPDEATILSTQKTSRVA